VGSTQMQESSVAADRDAPGRIIVGYRKGVTVLELVGEHDLTTADDVSDRVSEQASLGRGVVISLSETEFIDSSILRALFVGDRALLGRGRRLVLHLGRSDSVRRALELANANEQLLCCDSLDEAVAFAAQCSG
jgi:anti-anti-sigma factor